MTWHEFRIKKKKKKRTVKRTFESEKRTIQACDTSVRHESATQQ